MLSNTGIESNYNYTHKCKSRLSVLEGNNISEFLKATGLWRHQSAPRLREPSATCHASSCYFAKRPSNFPTINPQSNSLQKKNFANSPLRDSVSRSPSPVTGDPSPPPPPAGHLPPHAASPHCSQLAPPS